MLEFRKILTFQAENFGAVFSEAIPLLYRHWEEIALDKEFVQLDPDWEQYAAMEHQGLLSVVTVRAQGELVGYSCVIIRPHLHYRTCLTGFMDLFYIAPEHRGKHGGVRLFKAMEAECKRRGVQRIFVQSKLHKDSGRLFKALGYRSIEEWWSKLI